MAKEGDTMRFPDGIYQWNNGKWHYVNPIPEEELLNENEFKDLKIQVAKQKVVIPLAVAEKVVDLLADEAVKEQARKDNEELKAYLASDEYKKLETARKGWKHLSDLNKIHEHDEKEQAKSEELHKAFGECKESLKEAFKEADDVLYKK